MKHVPRVIAAHGMGAALHVNNACGHTFAGAVTGAPPETHSSEGGGVWAEYLPKAALTSNTLFLDDANVLVPVWLGGRGDRPAFPIGRNRIFINVESHRAVPRRRPNKLPSLAPGCVGYGLTSARAKPAHTWRAWGLGTRQIT